MKMMQRTWKLLLVVTQILIVTPTIVALRSAKIRELNDEGDIVMNHGFRHVNRELGTGKKKSGPQHKKRNSAPTNSAPHHGHDWSCAGCCTLGKDECTENPDCFWCQAVEGSEDGKCIRNEPPFNEGKRRRNACCQVAITEKACESNSDYGPTCLWATATIQDDLELTWCTALNCNYIRNETECTGDLGCVWYEDQCD